MKREILTTIETSECGRYCDDRCRFFIPPHPYGVCYDPDGPSEEWEAECDIGDGDGLQHGRIELDVDDDEKNIYRVRCPQCLDAEKKAKATNEA